MPNPRKPTEEEIKELLPDYDAAVATWHAKKDSRITGIDIGYLYDGSTRTDKIGVRTHTVPVEKATSDATARSEAGAKQVAPLSSAYSRGTPSLAQNVPPTNPVQPGVSVSSERSRGGTLGLIVYDKKSKEPHVLSCHHVLRSQTTKDVALQPAMYLGGTSLDPTHLLGRVERYIDDIDGDAAIATIQRKFERPQFRSGVLIELADMPSIGDVVEKDGMGTGVRCGFVDGFGQYKMGGPDGPMKGFRIVRGDEKPCREDLSQHADSGSVWYRKTDDKKHGIGVGLHVGGDMSVADENIRPAIACYLIRVLDALQVTILPKPSTA